MFMFTLKTEFKHLTFKTFDLRSKFLLKYVQYFRLTDVHFKGYSYTLCIFASLLVERLEWAPMLAAVRKSIQSGSLLLTLCNFSNRINWTSFLTRK